MKKLNRKNLLWSALGVLAVTGVASGFALAGDDEKETEIALPAATVTSAINAAVAAKPGNVSEVEIEVEKGVTHIEVEIVAADGKSYEVGVDAITGKVLSVEADDENENEMDEKGENETGEK